MRVGSKGYEASSVGSPSTCEYYCGNDLCVLSNDDESVCLTSPPQSIWDSDF